MSSQQIGEQKEAQTEYRNLVLHSIRIQNKAKPPLKQPARQIFKRYSKRKDQNPKCLLKGGNKIDPAQLLYSLKHFHESFTQCCVCEMNPGWHIKAISFLICYMHYCSCINMVQWVSIIDMHLVVRNITTINILKVSDVPISAEYSCRNSSAVILIVFVFPEGDRHSCFTI